MKKLMSRALSLLLCALLLLTPVCVFAEAELGEYENPYIISTTDMNRTSVAVAPGGEAWVKVNTCDSTVSVGYATNTNYMISYNNRVFYPETTSGNNSLIVGMTAGVDMFCVKNTSATDYVVTYITLEEGQFVDNTGTIDNPEAVALEPDPRTGVIGARVETVLEKANEGYHYQAIAPADGIITVSIYTYDEEYNPIGWFYSVSNLTAERHGDIHYSSDEPVQSIASREVSQGDRILVMASTYDPARPYVAPEGTVAVTFSFSPVGSMECPQQITETGDGSTELAAGNQGHYYKWTAEADGTVTFTVNDTENWQYCINIAMANYEYYYGDFRLYYDDPAINSETYNVVAGDVVEIFVATCDENNPWANPKGTVNWTLSFTEAGSIIWGDVNNDEGVSVADVLLLRKYLADVVTEDDINAAAADVNGDGELTTADVLNIRKYLADIITVFPAEEN